jgi:hypothetical protein
VNTASYECAYCGSTAGDTDDHVPPKSIYSAPLPSDPPTVKACAPCNAGASQDDEYFRDVVVKYHRVADLPQAQEQVEAMIRAAGKPAKRRYAEATWRSFVDVERRTPAGLIIGTAPAYVVDAPRIERSVRRYVRGLHRYQLGKRVPDGFTINVAVNADHVRASAKDVADVFAAARRRIVQAGVFWYAWVSPRDRPEASAWLLVFFDAFPLMGFVHPPGAETPKA